MDISLGISPCPNDIFIFSGIILEKAPTDGLRFSVVYDDVETLNRQSQSSELDLVKISYANYLRCEAQYDLLDCGGALGYGCGPLLLANGSHWDPDREILSPGEFTTANFLLDFFAQQPLKKRFLPFDALYEELCRTPGAQGVVIHEKRFTYSQEGLTLIKDLGSHWEEQTGCAIPLGAIAIRRSLNRKPQMEEIIRRSLRWAYDHYDEAFHLCQEHAQDLTPSVIRAHIELYVNRFSEEVGAEGRATIAYFLEQQRRFAGR